MIKFFRKIRFDLMETGKTGKPATPAGRYLKYAIGEIVLVMIGILLALQINNWNEHRKERIKEQVILKQLKEDYLADLNQLEQKMEMRNTIIKSAFEIFNAMDHPDEVSRDSLIKDIADMSDDPTFDPIQNNLINSGNLNLITNEKLKRLLSHWSSDVVALQEIEVIWSDKINHELDPLLAKLGIARDVANSWMNDSDHIWMLDDNFNASENTIGTSKLSTPVDKIVASKELEGVVSNAITFNKPAILNRRL